MQTIKMFYQFLIKMNFNALGIGRATVLCNNAELVNPKVLEGNFV